MCNKLDSFVASRGTARGRCGLMRRNLKHRQHEGDGGQRGAEEWLPDSEAQEREGLVNKS